MKTIKRLIAPAFSGIAALYLLAACNGLLEPPPAVSGGKTGRVVISIAGPGEAAGSRTLLPEWGDIEYKLEFTRQGETEPAITRTIAETTVEQDLEPEAVYTLNVTAYKAGATVAVARGSVSGITARLEESVSVTVSLTLNQSGAGTLKYNVALPEGMTLSGGFLTLYPLPGGADSTNIDLSAGLSGAMDIPLGYYRARLVVYGALGGAGKHAAKTTVLHISDSLTTTASYPLTAGDFTDTEQYIVENELLLNDALRAIRNAPGSVYTIVISAGFSCSPVSLAGPEYNEKTILLRGDGGVREIRLASQGSLFTVGAADSEPVFVLRDITLKGVDGNNAPLVRLEKGELSMEGGAVVTGNTNSSGNGGGVYVSGGTFTMKDSASVHGNAASAGGGVYANAGTFDMNGGEISDNYGSSGGGVYVVNGGMFTMSDGAISGNSTSYNGGGVSVYGTFTMNGGEISGNTASGNGGGVYVAGGAFTMKDSASVHGNAASAGGGVYANAGTFDMNGGEISGNSASYGGGVYVYSGTFTKQSGGVIYGSDASGTLKNTATGDEYSHAVYVKGGKWRGTTSGSGVTLDSNVGGSAGGWWEPPPMPTTSLQNALTWLNSYAARLEDNREHSITINTDETIAPQPLSYSGKNVHITLTGDSMERTISLSSNGSLFTIESGVTLTLGNNVTLRGMSGNTASLVRVNGGGRLVMNAGSEISGNEASASSGGGVYVGSGGTFTMSGGEISGNSTSYNGGGVCVNGGTFTKESGGVIYGSDASDTLKNIAAKYGHVVYVINNSHTKWRNITADSGVTFVTLDNKAGGWENTTAGISGITYSSISGGAWTLENGRYKSPAISDRYGETIARISFTSVSDASIKIELEVSGGLLLDVAFISELDNASATYDGSSISGKNSVTVLIPVTSPGSHFIDIVHRKNGTHGSTCAWFKVIE